MRMLTVGLLTESLCRLCVKYSLLSYMLLISSDLAIHTSTTEITFSYGQSLCSNQMKTEADNLLPLRSTDMSIWPSHWSGLNRSPESNRSIMTYQEARSRNSRYVNLTSGQTATTIAKTYLKEKSCIKVNSKRPAAGQTGRTRTRLRLNQSRQAASITLVWQ